MLFELTPALDVSQLDNRRADVLKNIILRTIRPPTVSTICRALARPSLDIVAGELIPRDHLLGAFDALGAVVAAVDGWLGLRERRGARRARDVAAVARHVHVRLAAAVGHPQPGAVAAARRAGGQGGGDGVGGEALPRRVRQRGEDDQVLHRDRVQVRRVADGERGAGGHALVVRVHGTVVLDAVGRVAGAGPVFRVCVAVRPL